MATNQFLSFGQGTGANVLSQTDWAALAARTGGFQAGTASSAAANKAWRQALLASSALGQIIADLSGSDALDTDTPAQMAAKILQGLSTISGGGWFIAPTGSSSFTVPAGVTRIHIRCWGAGGGGGGCAGGAASGGAGGGYAEGYFTVTPGQVLPVTVGAGGIRGEGTPTSGTAGGTSSVGALISATGGGGGQGVASGGAAPINSAFGIGYGGQINMIGNPANAGLIIGGTPLGSSGGGTFGASMVGGYSANRGNSPAFPGGGGGGAGGSAAAQGYAGADGLVIIEY